MNDRLLTEEKWERLLEKTVHKVNEEWVVKSDEARKQIIAETRREVGEWLEGNIMRTDNRVTKLWVLGDLVQALKKGEMPK